MIVLPHNFLLSYFILGLKPHIRHEVQALQSLNLMHAIDLAKLQEDKFSEIHKFQRNTYATPTYPFFSNTILTFCYVISTFCTKPTNNIPFKKLSPSNLQGRREKDLCYTCDEKIIPGHKCKGKFFLIVQQEEIKDDLTTPPDLVLPASDNNVPPMNSGIEICYSAH